MPLLATAKKVGECSGYPAKIRRVFFKRNDPLSWGRLQIGRDTMGAAEIKQVGRIVDLLGLYLGDRFSPGVVSVILEVMKEEDLSPETYCERQRLLEPAQAMRIIKKLTGEPNNWRQDRQIIWWRTSKEGVDTIRLASRGRSLRGRLIDTIQDPY